MKDSHTVRKLDESRRLTGVPSSLIIAARKLFEQHGVSGVTVKDITEEAGVTRELFYYSFSSKNALIDAVIDDYVEDFIESVAVWNEMRRFGDMKGSLESCICSFRRVMCSAEGLRPITGFMEELGIHDEFVRRVVREASEFLDRHVASEYARYHNIEIDHVREMLALVLFGIAGIIRMDPDVSDEVLMKLVEQTLHLDMSSREQSHL